jgi:hypothetical protein
MHKNIIMLIISLLLLICISLAIGCYFSNINEGFSNEKQSIPSTGIPDGFYKVDENNMLPVPYGYNATTDKSSIFPISNATLIAMNAKNTAENSGFSGGFAGSGANNTIIDYNTLYGNTAPTEASYNNLTKYDTNNYNTQYHEDVETLKSQNYQYGLDSETITVKDMSGNTVVIPVPTIQGQITYYQPGTYRFGASSYVPNYEDSVFLSRTSGLSSTSPIENTASMLGGSCSYYKNNPDKLEEICQSVDKNNCGSMNCCVLLGGSKCVSGNESGPTMKANYSDIFVKNRDFYYYNGKCYGNCK